MMKKVISTMLICSALIASGCSTLNGLITDGTNNFTGEPEVYYQTTYKQPNKDVSLTTSIQTKASRAEQFLTENAERIRLVFNQEYAPVYPNSELDIQIQKTSSGTSLDLNWKSPTAFFGLGQYDLATTKTYNGREGVAFIDFISDAISNIIAKLDDAGMTGKYRVVATLFGQADGTPIRGKLIYRGEYGEIHMPANQTLLNGKPHEFRIVRHQQISNSELAAIRAYGIASYIRGALYNVPIEERYNIRVVRERGFKFRSASVKLEVMEME